MKCSKCKREIPNNTKICPYCHKVLALECPNCHSVGESPVCEKCGYIILTKCSKCGRTVSTAADKCKCGFPTKTSVAYQECESDEFASVIVRFAALRQIRNVLGSQELFSKFYFRLRNLLIAQLSGVEGKIIIYNDIFTINFNKELSLPTSANKAVRLALKIANAFCELNAKVLEELAIPLKLEITIIKKAASDLLENISINNNVKLLTVKKESKKYLKGLQVNLDQYIQDCVNKDFKTDSLYSIEENGQQLMFYEILLDSYIVPPNETSADTPVEIQKKHEISKIQPTTKEPEDIYGVKIFDINAKCKFEKSTATQIFDSFKENKIISLRTSSNLGVKTSDIANYYTSKDIKVLHAVCSEEMTYKPWGIFEQLFKDYYNLSFHSSLLPQDFAVKRFSALIDLIKFKPRNAATPEDARFAYMEDFGAFLASLKNCAILIEDFENLDDTSIQTLELYFDQFKTLNATFIFTTNQNIALHTKLKGLLRTPNYTEYTIQASSLESLLDGIKEEASDFIKSFYFEKIKENFNGSYLYFNHALKFLLEKNIIVSFENRLLLKGNQSIMLPNSLEGLIKARLKHLSKDMDASMILAYSTYLGARMDFAMLTKLGIKDVIKSAKKLIDADFAFCRDNVLYINNYNLVKPVIDSSIKPQINEFLSKNILANLAKGLDNTTTLFILGKLSIFKEEYLLLWKNSQFAMTTGDYDAYLKNCLGFLSLIEHISHNIPAEDIENNKREVYQNILMSLYNYSPSKIYSIENILLIDAMNENNNDKIVKLSNLMLQGALISANYTDALTLLHNILSRMQNPTLLVEGSINTKFLLLSLINIEILFNIGDFEQCVETANDILAVLKPEIIEKIKPASFSTNFFVNHLMETFRLAAFAKLLLMDDELDNFFNAISIALNAELPDKECILAIRDFIAGKSYHAGDIENSTPFAKVVYLILQEFEHHSNDYKTFAQNIYQAKLLAADIHQKQLEMFCDLLIAHSYASLGIFKKAEIIYNDILTQSEEAAIATIATITKYFITKLYLTENKNSEALILINDTLALLQKYNNQFKVMYVLFEKLFIETAQTMELDNIDVETEEQKLSLENSNGKFARLL